MIYRATKQTVDKYFNDSGISQSQIKLYIKGFDYYLRYKDQIKSDKYFDEPADHLIIGNGVDTLLTYEEGIMEKMYYVGVSAEKPSPLEISMLRYVFDQITSREPLVTNLGDITNYKNTPYRKYLLESVTYHNYYPKWNEDSRIKPFETDTIGRYWTDMTQCKGRQILTLEEQTLIKTLAANLRTSNYTRHLFMDQGSRYDIFYQVPIYTSIKGIRVKGLIDIVVIDYQKETIIPWDIKTMGDGVLMFPKSYRKYGYDFQASFYYHLLESTNITKHISLTTEKVERIKSFAVNDFKFAVVSKSFPNSPAVAYSVGDSIQDIILGKDLSYFNSVSNSGRFYEHKHHCVTSIDDYVTQLYQSIQEGTDIRLTQELNLSNL